MATIAEQLTSLANTKTAIKDAIVAKGVSVVDTDPFSAYAAKIGEISGGGSTEEWQPNPNWWDIKGILDADTREYPGKVGVILYNFNDVSDFYLSLSGMTAVATSDGAFYTYADNGSKVSHNWDAAQDKDDGRGFKTRWVIYYYTTDTTSDTFQQGSTNFGWAYNYIAYLVLRINCSNARSFCADQHLLEAIENAGYVINSTSFIYFLNSCYSLERLPEGLDTSASTSFLRFCYYCHSLTKLPDTLDTSAGTDFSGFCDKCYILKELPEGLDTSAGTDFSGFCGECSSLTRIPDNLNTANGTNFSYFLQKCYFLSELPSGLDTSNGTNFSNFCYYCSSLQKLPDGLDTSNGTNFSNFCAYCSSLQKLPDGLNTSNGTNFSEFCSHCSSLQKLPDGLDTSNGTNFSEFCYICSSLCEAPDKLNTEKGTNLSSFLGSCSLWRMPEFTMSANTTTYASYNCPASGMKWLREIRLTLPNNTNFWLSSSTRISIESFRYIADHAPDVTATPRTLTIGSTNITRCNEADPTIITDLNAKGWTVA